MDFSFDSLFVCGCIDLDLLCEGDILLLIVRDNVDITLRHTKLFDEEMSVVPREVVEDDRDERRLFESYITTLMDRTHKLSRETIVVFNFWIVTVYRHRLFTDVACISFVASVYIILSHL